MSKPKTNPSLLAAYIGAVATLFSATVALLPKLGCDGPKSVPAVNQKDANSWTPLFMAARDDKTAVVDALLAQGADPNQADNHGWTPLFQAARQGNARMVRDLVAKGAAVDIQSDMKETPLHLAAANGDLDTITAIATDNDGKAVVNVNAEDIHGLRPLHYAARKGHGQAVRLLLSLGAEDSKNDQGQTAMDLASNSEVKDALKQAQPHTGRGNPLKIKIF